MNDHGSTTNGASSAAADPISQKLVPGHLALKGRTHMSAKSNTEVGQQTGGPTNATTEGGRRVEGLGLVRTLSRFQSFALAFSFISITTGIFSTFGLVLANGGPRGIWTWPIAGIGIVCVALVYGMLASKIPLNGYSYQWISQLVSPPVGWFFGWMSFSCLAMSTVAVDYSFTQTALFPLLGVTYTADRGAVITVAVILVQAGLIIWSTPITAKINGLSVAAELAAMIGLVLLLGAVVIFGHQGDWGNLGSRGTLPSQGYWKWLGPFMLCGLLGVFTLGGWEAAANLAEETHNPKQVIPRAMVRAVAISGVIGMLFLIVLSVAAGHDVGQVTSSSAPVAEIISLRLGSVITKITLVVVCVAVFACGLVIMVSYSRLTHAMARDDRLPAAGLLKRVPRATGGPTWSVVTCATISIVIVIAFIGNPDALGQFIGASSTLGGLVYFGTVCIHVFTRHRARSGDDFRLGRWEVPVLVVALAWMVLALSIFVLPGQFRPAQNYAGGTLVVGLVVLLVLWLTKRDRFSRSANVRLDEVNS